MGGFLFRFFFSLNETILYFFFLLQRRNQEEEDRENPASTESPDKLTVRSSSRGSRQNLRYFFLTGDERFLYFVVIYEVDFFVLFKKTLHNGYKYKYSNKTT